MDACEKYKALLMGLIDQELTPEETKEVNDHLVRCEKCREAYDALRETGETIGAISFKEPTDEVLEKLWKPPYSRFIKLSGFMMILGGWLVLVIMAIVEAFRESQEPFLSRIASGSLLVGLVVLLAYVILERIAIYKTDPYKGVKR